MLTNVSSKSAGMWKASSPVLLEKRERRRICKQVKKDVNCFKNKEDLGHSQHVIERFHFAPEFPQTQIIQEFVKGIQHF